MPFSSPNEKSTARRLVIIAIAITVSSVLIHLRHAKTGTVLAPKARPPAEVRQTGAPVGERMIPAAEARRPHGEAIAPTASTDANDEVTLSWMREILQALSSSDKTVRNNALTFLLPALVQKDASAAGVLAEANTTMETREEVMRRVAQLWAAQDQAGALAWAVALSPPEERDATISDICLEIARTDPGEAVRLRDRYAASDHLDHPDSTLVNLAQQWAEKNWTAALDWAARRPEGNERNEMISRLAFVQAETSPANAARLILERIPPGETQTEAMSAVLHRWLAHEPGAASAWVKELPDGPLRTRALQEFAGAPRR